MTKPHWPAPWSHGSHDIDEAAALAGMLERLFVASAQRHRTNMILHGNSTIIAPCCRRLTFAPGN